jgi:hypothetical protein
MEQSDLITTPERVDWERVEELFRAGVLSLREIGRLCKVGESAIRKRAKRDSWTRDLSDRVRAQVRSDLVRSPVRSDSGGDQVRTVRTEREVIQEAAATVVEVVRDHRGSIKSTRRIVELLAAQLMDVVENRAELEEIADEATAEDKGKDRYARLMRAIALPGHIVSAKELSLAQKVLIGLERQAFGLGDVDDPTPSDEGKSTGITPSDEALAKLDEFLNGAAAPA